jgi:hydroxymethylglutaryl-CoA lyase
VFYPSSVRIVEVGPRDGLQNEARSITTAQKIQFIQNLAGSGLQTIEAGSFVSPRSVPQMADSAEVFRGLRRRAGVTYTALVPNLRGLKDALLAELKEVAVFASASETFSQRNIKCSIAESLQRYREVTQEAARNSLRVRAYISCVAGCPYEGPVSSEAVQMVANELIEMGCYEVSLGDTIGVGTPSRMEKLLKDLLAHLPASKFAVHFHDTWGLALANILIALQAGISVVDSSTAGLGGCPYAPGATGNAATEDVVHMLHGMNIETGVNIDAVAQAGREICTLLKRPVTSKAALALAARGRR